MTTTGYASCDHTPSYIHDAIDHRPNYVTDRVAAARHVLDLTRLNLPLLDKVRSHSAAHPEEHDQDTWAVRRPECGTVMCFAGWAVHFAGHTLCWEPRAVGQAAHFLVDGRPISNAARDDLGLTNTEARALFGYENTRADLDWLIERITDGALHAADREYRPLFCAQDYWALVEIERNQARELLAAVEGS